MDEPLILDRYRPLAELGSGGHGSVVLAFDTKMARRVAIKRLPLDRRSRSQGVGLAEARTAAMLNHPNIVTVHEWETDDTHAHIVMEHIEGASLATILDDIGAPLGPDEAAAVIGALAEALDFAHRNGVLHLDIKPGNVLVTPEGRVKLADFGIAALTDVGGRARGGGGTIGYMPPEQIRGEEVDDATDQWALAALTFETLTLANPFDADTIEGSLFKAEIADVPAPSEFASDIPPGIDRVLLAALSPDPADRYTSIAEFADRILEYLGDPKVGAAMLAEQVGELIDEEAKHVDGLAALGLWDRLARVAGMLRRLGAAAACGWLGWAGLAPLDLGQPATLGAIALVSLAAALAPALGVALGLLATTVGVGVELGVPAAAVVLVLAAAWWAARGRHGEGDVVAPVAGPLLGIARSAGAVPLLLGFVFPPGAAAASAALASAVTLTASAATGASAPLLDVDWRFMLDPLALSAAADLSALIGVGPIAVVVAWSVAAAIMSFFARSGTRLSATLGALLALVVLRIGYAVWEFTGAPLDVGALYANGGVVLGITALTIALGPPTRGES